MLGNLIASLFISFGVGVSSFNMVHNTNFKSENIVQYEELTNYADCYKYFNSIDKIYLKDLDFNNPSIVYQLPSYEDFSLSSSTVDNVVIDISDGSRILDIGFFDGGDDSYYLRLIGPFGTRDIYNLDEDNNYIYYSTFESFNINLSDWYIVSNNVSFNHAIGFLIFYFSEYSFNGSLYDLSQSKPISLFSTALLDDYFGFSDIHGVQVVYKGWFKCNDVYFNQINMTIIDAQGTKYYDGMVQSSDSLHQLTSTSDTYAYIMNIEFINTITQYSVYAYLPRYYAIGNTLSTYIDISYKGWNVSQVEFISVSCVGMPQVRNDLISLGYYKVITHSNDLVSSSTSNNNIWLNNTFTLINSALLGLSGLFSIQILPFVNLGTLIFLPLLFVIVLFVVKLFKR